MSNCKCVVRSERIRSRAANARASLAENVRGAASDISERPARRGRARDRVSCSLVGCCGRNDRSCGRGLEHSKRRSCVVAHIRHNIVVGSIAMNRDGMLPAGVHWAAWHEIESRFGHCKRRRQLLNGLRSALKALGNAGCRKSTSTAASLR